MYIHTQTIKDYIEVVKWALNRDIKWINGSISILEDQWNEFKVNTCIVIQNEELSYYDINLVYKYCKKDEMINKNQIYLIDKIQFAKKFDLK